mmetsp:Transcript_5637/g.9740  ORF Transcript_5637/g.9740 Transcript_5637/m.9740 type:complete len:343 (-) Transcript_5637:572-1600(-)|eukprot:CAMPEP_0196662878 /NCGR_PEP_ID=MMETSP1086-20130531/50657_1 /TAXON_ID=77921 /ORGANISM="Cyanoptyche  gloeocystis , Strain SAG4.97" /LENGTH=342 /DNA_ID=CAMNT_0041998489 /DNA_START=52 /DNA_END=1080 /DNA_ORIENTATION=+
MTLLCFSAAALTAPSDAPHHNAFLRPSGSKCSWTQNLLRLKSRKSFFAAAPVKSRSFSHESGPKFLVAEEGVLKLHETDPIVYEESPDGRRLFSITSIPQQIMQWNPVPKPGAKPTSKKVFMVRHGQSSWNTEGKIQGRSNYSVLTEKGEKQAIQTGDALRLIDFDVVYSSPLKRARQTAEIIVSRNDHVAQVKGGVITYEAVSGSFGGVPLRTLKTLLEIDLKEWEGLTKQQVKEQFPEEYEAWTFDPLSLTLGEEGRNPIVEIWQQALEAWEDILNDEGSIVLVVAHNAIIKAMVAVALGLDVFAYRTLLQGNGGISIVNFQPNGMVELESMNSTSHIRR